MRNYIRAVVVSSAMLAVHVPAHAADKISHLVPGYLHSCAMTESGAVYCWGMEYVNGRPESTTSANRVIGIPPAVALASGHVNSCIIDVQGSAWCWGLDLQASVDTKRAVMGGPKRVSSLPPVTLIATGFLRSCAVAESDGAVWCWGANPAGELGDGSTEDRSLPVRASGLAGATWIAAGVNNTCAITSDGTAQCWGTDMQSGPGVLVKSSIPTPAPLATGQVRIANGRNFFCALNNSKSIACFGSNIMNQLGDTSLGKTYTKGSPQGLGEAVAIGTGGFFGCALRPNGKIACWGHLPGSTSITFEGVEPQDLANVDGARHFGVGLGTVCWLRDDRRVLCWGNNQTGQLGNGRTSDFEGVPVEVLGLPSVSGTQDAEANSRRGSPVGSAQAAELQGTTRAGWISGSGSPNAARDAMSPAWWSDWTNKRNAAQAQ